MSKGLDQLHFIVSSECLNSVCIDQCPLHRICSLRYWLLTGKLRLHCTLNSFPQISIYNGMIYPFMKSGVSLTFSARGELVFAGGQNFLFQLLYKINFLPDRQTRWEKPSSQPGNLSRAQALNETPVKLLFLLQAFLNL